VNFSALSIRNPVPAIMLFALLTLAGLLAYKANPVQDFPDIELPIVTVTAATARLLETPAGSRCGDDSRHAVQRLQQQRGAVLLPVRRDLLTGEIHRHLDRWIRNNVDGLRDRVLDFGE